MKQRGATPSRKRAALACTIAILLAVLAVGVSYRRARAQLTEGLLDAGAEMMRYADARRQDAPRELVLNGQSFRFRSGHADGDVDSVLDFFAARCAAVDGGLTERVGALRESHAVPGASSPVLREADDRGGFVACLDFGVPDLSVAELAARLRRFHASHDVADVGEVRYVFARRSREGRVHFVTVWSRGSLDLDAMFPERGDAPGLDPLDVPRPPNARRVLSGLERGEPYALAVYESTQDQADLARFYRHALPDAGWSVLADRALIDPPTLVAERGQSLVTIVLGTDLERRVARAAVIEAR